jgi:hypothetical protein
MGMLEEQAKAREYWDGARLKEWEEAFPIGTPVIYWPNLRDKAHVETRIASVPWVRNDGYIPVVQIDGKAGGVLITHIQRDLSRKQVTPAPAVTPDLKVDAGFARDLKNATRDPHPHLVAIGDHTFVLASLVHIGPLVPIERAINPAAYSVVGYKFAVTGVGFAVEVESLVRNVYDLYGEGAGAALDLAHKTAGMMRAGAVEALGRAQRGNV